MDQNQQETNHECHGEATPSLDIQQLAIAALEMHPQYLVAASNSCCVPKVKLIPTHFAERIRWQGKEKAATIELLKGCEHFILVSYFTAATSKDALAGNGTIYDFALHPNTMEVLHASTSFWVS